MKSTMDSMKEEQRVMESAFEEKQNEIRMLQGHGNNMGNEGPKEVIALTENLKQKENETIREEQPGVENNANGGGAVRKHSHASRTMGKFRRMNGMNMEAREQRVDEIRQLEKQDDNFVQQYWSGRLINKADKNAGQVKSNMFHEQPEELQENGNVHEDNDDFFKESQSDFDDEKEEYREEIDR